MLNYAIEGMNQIEVMAGQNTLLSSYATGYTNADFKGRWICPFAEVPTRTGSTVEFDDSTFNSYDDSRAAGGPFNEIQTGYKGLPYSLEIKGLLYKVPIQFQEQAATANIKLGKLATNSLMQAEALNIELEQARVARNPASYNGNAIALSGASQFSDPSSRPDREVERGKLAIASTCGRKPNVILGGELVTSALRTHPQVRSNFTPTSSAAITDEMLAQYFNVEHYVSAEAIWQNPITGLRQFVWGRDLILAYVNPKAFVGDKKGYIPYATANGIDMLGEPSKFYTYVLENEPRVSNPYWNWMNDSWYYKINFERQTLTTGMNSGFLIQNAVAA